MSLHLQTTGTPIELLAYDPGDGGYVTVRYVDGPCLGRVRCVPVARVKATGGQVELHNAIHKVRAAQNVESRGFASCLSALPGENASRRRPHYE